MKRRQMADVGTIMITLAVMLFIGYIEMYGQTRVLTRTLTVETVDKHGKMTGRVERHSDITFVDGKIFERVLSQTGSLGPRIKDDRWNLLGLVSGFKPDIARARWWLVMGQYRGSEPLITEIDLEK